MTWSWPGEVERDGPPARERMRGFPVAHRLVHPPAVQIGADRPLEFVDERVYLLVRCRPFEASVRVGGVAVERHDGRVDQRAMRASFSQVFP